LRDASVLAFSPASRPQEGHAVRGHAKTHYVIVDAIGVTKSLKTASEPLITKPTVPLKDLAMGVMMGVRDDDTVSSLAGRLARLNNTPLVLVVDPSLPVRSVPEFIAYAKANPGKLNLGSAGLGTPVNVTGELFKMKTGINVGQVQYRGSAPALADLLGGQVQAMFPVIAEAIEYIRAGRLRALAVTSTARSDVLPDIPIMADYVSGVEAGFWAGVVAPKNTPVEIIGRLNKEINAGLADAVMKARFADLGATVFPGTPAEFGKFIADETEKWAKVVKFANIKAD
jgi:tripartite-type tricarboxylate transporter receptor subunit TctC